MSTVYRNHFLKSLIYSIVNHSLIIPRWFVYVNGFILIFLAASVIIFLSILQESVFVSMIFIFKINILGTSSLKKSQSRWFKNKKSSPDGLLLKEDMK